MNLPPKNVLLSGCFKIGFGSVELSETKRASYRLVRGGQIAAVKAKVMVMGTPKQTLEDWVGQARRQRSG